MPFNILLLLKFFSKAISGVDKNFSLFAKKIILATLSLSVMSKKLLNLLFMLSDSYGKLKKKKTRAALTF